MKKFLVLVAALAILAPIAVSAQDAAAAGETKSVSKVFNMGVGFVSGYALSSGTMVVGRDFGVHFVLNRSIEVGFRSINGLVGNVVLLDFVYYIAPVFALDLMVGSNGTSTVAALDANYYLFRSKSDDIFSSSLKIKAGYIFDSGVGIAEGVPCFGLIGTIGY